MSSLSLLFKMPTDFYLYITWSMLESYISNSSNNKLYLNTYNFLRLGRKEKACG